MMQYFLRHEILHARSVSINFTVDSVTPLVYTSYQVIITKTHR